MITFRNYLKLDILKNNVIFLKVYHTIKLDTKTNEIKLDFLKFIRLNVKYLELKTNKSETKAPQIRSNT